MIPKPNNKSIIIIIMQKYQKTDYVTCRNADLEDGERNLTWLFLDSILKTSDICCYYYSPTHILLHGF